MGIILRDTTNDYYKKSELELLDEIKNITYPVKVPLEAVVSEKYIEKIGIPGVEFRNIVTGETRSVADYKRLVDRKFTILQMMEVFENGYPIEVVNESLVKRIFYTCDAYLYKKRTLKEYIPNMTVTDDEFLDRLDVFTKDISITAKGTIYKVTYKREDSVFLDEYDVHNGPKKLI